TERDASLESSREETGAGQPGATSGTPSPSPRVVCRRGGRGRANRGWRRGGGLAVVAGRARGEEDSGAGAGGLTPAGLEQLERRDRCPRLGAQPGQGGDPPDESLPVCPLSGGGRQGRRCHGGAGRAGRRPAPSPSPIAGGD